MAIALTIKNGETFLFNGQYTENDGVTPKSLAGVTLSSQIRDKDDLLIDTLVVTVTNEAAGTFTVTTTNSTDLWTVGSLFWDLKYIINGIKGLTETISVKVVQAVTHG